MDKLRFSGKYEKIKIDKKDITLMQKISTDSRVPLTKLTKDLGLSRDSINYRMNRLKKAGIIQKFYAGINLQRFGYKPFHFFMIVDERKKDLHKDLNEFMEKHPATRRITTYSDRWDLSWTVMARNLEEFDKIRMELYQRFSSIIIDKTLLATITKYQISSSPYMTKEDYKEQYEEIELDKTDAKLLRLLAANARENAIKLGSKLKLSSDAVIYRIKRLRNAGIIKYFTTLFDLSRLDYHLYTYCIACSKFDQKAEAKLKEFIYQNPSIIRAEKTFGDYDVMLQIAAKTPQEFHRLIKELKIQFADIMDTYDAWIANEERYDVLPDIL